MITQYVIDNSGKVDTVDIVMHFYNVYDFKTVCMVLDALKTDGVVYYDDEVSKWFAM